VLREVARRIGETAGGEACVARTGGDTFAVIPGRHWASEADGRGHLEAMASELASAFATPVRVGDQPINVTLSIGVATFPLGEGTAAAVFARADMALQHAKRRGRNNTQAFAPELQHKAERKYRVFEGLRRAIEAQELALHFQPQVAPDGSVPGAEALVRWRSAQLGAVSPGDFIPLAEETGLIHALGEWTLRAACTQLAAWQAAGVAFHGHLAVNVSPWQLARADFVPRLREIIAASGVRPQRLTIEITESAVLFDVSETVARLRELGSLGVRIALDDFGTGYSSLSLIKDLPLDEIKIDQSFVRHLSTGNQQLIKVVLAVGAELGLAVIAEGVETERERDLLHSLGCRELQGFLFCRPLPAEEFVAWLTDRESGSPVDAPARKTEGRWLST
jgi:predicted signal transduction protein with EAL and GGDEF domain